MPTDPSALYGARGDNGALAFVAPLQGSEPEVPEKALALGISGRVVVEMHLDPWGRVEEARVVESPMAGLFDRSATLAVRAARFPPVIENGLPVRSVRRTVIIYRLS